VSSNIDLLKRQRRAAKVRLAELIAMRRIERKQTDTHGPRDERVPRP
jgi:hypothetical protein